MHVFEHRTPTSPTPTLSRISRQIAARITNPVHNNKAADFPRRS